METMRVTSGFAFATAVFGAAFAEDFLTGVGVLLAMFICSYVAVQYNGAPQHSQDLFVHCTKIKMALNQYHALYDICS